MKRPNLAGTHSYPAIAGTLSIPRWNLYLDNGVRHDLLVADTWRHQAVGKKYVLCFQVAMDEKIIVLEGKTN